MGGEGEGILKVTLIMSWGEKKYILPLLMRIKEP